MMDKDATSLDSALQRKTMPSREAFEGFFSTIVSSSMKEMTLDEFLQYEPVDTLLSAGLILSEDVSGLWISNVGDASGLDIDEGYEMLCMTMDLPDPEDLEFLNEAFATLSAESTDGHVSFMTFLGWSDIQNMISEGVITMEQVTEFWRNVAGDLNKSIDKKKFYKINSELDLFLDEDDQNVEIVNSSEESGKAGSEGEVTTSPGAGQDGAYDVYDPAFDPRSVFDDTSVKEIEEVFISNAGSEGMVLRSFLQWGEVKDVIAEDAISMGDVLDLWDAATKFMGKDTVDLDTFLRLNIALDDVLDATDSTEQTEADNTTKNKASSGGAESFYRAEFNTLSQNGLVTLDALLSWSEVAELISDGAVTRNQIRQMFDGMPKETKNDISGISQDSFIGFNGMLDVVLDAAGPQGSETTKVTQAATPTMLTSEETRPMPQSGELTMDDLDELKGDAEKFGKNEMAMMETLDQADAMLLSGSFSTFDALIGDENDPRLQKEAMDESFKNEDAKIILSELVSLAKKQGRAGLDRPTEEEEGRLRNLLQALLDSSPKMAKRSKEDVTESITGDWRLLYTNSEMFDFYNGISGFVNVFPSSSFESLTASYQSDGYLSESTYLEKLTTPLGGIDVKVFSNWEVQKEMSFMTNEESVLLRAYANKVTAGPFEYEAQENWKSLRTMSMNEIVYLDDQYKIVRNCGALRIFFIYEKQSV